MAGRFLLGALIVGAVGLCRRIFAQTGEFPEVSLFIRFAQALKFNERIFQRFGGENNRRRPLKKSKNSTFQNDSPRISFEAGFGFAAPLDHGLIPASESLRRFHV